MVALFILAVALTALQTRIVNHLDATAHLRDKTIAQWVALNQLELLRLENRNSNQLIRKQRSGVASMADQQWFWTIQPETLANNELILPLRITVHRHRADGDTSSPLISMLGVIDGYHSP